MITHFYSDPHFGHENVIAYADRPFRDAREMEEAFVAGYREVVSGRDVVCWCGDAFFGPAEYGRAVLGRLPGTKILVRGNHDGSSAKMLAMGFDLVVDEMAVLLTDGTVATVSHYPYAGSPANRTRRSGELDDRYLDRRPKPKPGRVLVHGHTHSKVRRVNNQIHVGVDAWDYRPACMGEVAALAAEWRRGR